MAAIIAVVTVVGLAAEPPAAKPEAKPAAKPDEKPITTASGPVGNLLRKWYAEGTAAGHKGDLYDNRDRGHSELDRGPYPQLQKFQYSEREKQLRLDWALQGRVVPGIIFGNSSTSAGVMQGGSNPRMCYTIPLGLFLLCAQYARNNLYMYPEHVDYKPGHNGSPGYGDIYPTNTPYLIISQGSSGTDQPFMQAVAATLAAFRPDVKALLARRGVLMPTVQMIFRASNKQVKEPREYLTGKAHPTVFQGGDVDALKMVQMAHAITIDHTPPMVEIEVVEEDHPVAGRDFFEPSARERLANTPCVVARIARSRAYRHRMVLSAANSFDLNHRPLRYHWVVLRGDASRIRITPLEKDGSRAEVIVPWHDRRPIAEGSALESNRVDIGVFVHNGEYYSPPAFLTYLFLDHEARTYDPDGRLLEIGYGFGALDLQVPDWAKFLGLLRSEDTSPGGRLLKKILPAEQVKVLLRVGDEYKEKTAALESARKATAEARKAKQAEAQIKSLGDTESKAAKAVEDLLANKREGLPASPKETVLGAIRAQLARATFSADEHSAPGADLRKQFIAWGLLKDTPDGAVVLQPVRSPEKPDPAALTRFEKELLEQFNAELLKRLMPPGLLNYACPANFVDPRFSPVKKWRDVYHYGPQGQSAGWTRYDGQRKVDFNDDGLMVLEKDAGGRCVKAQAVRYEQDGAAPPRGSLNWNPVRWLPDDEIRKYPAEQKK